MGIKTTPRDRSSRREPITTASFTSPENHLFGSKLGNKEKEIKLDTFEPDDESVRNFFAEVG